MMMKMELKARNLHMCKFWWVVGEDGVCKKEKKKGFRIDESQVVSIVVFAALRSAYFGLIGFGKIRISVESECYWSEAIYAMGSKRRVCHKWRWTWTLVCWYAWAYSVEAQEAKQMVVAKSLWGHDSVSMMIWLTTKVEWDVFIKSSIAMEWKPASIILLKSLHMI